MPEHKTQKNLNIKVYFFCTWLFSVFLSARFLADIPNDTLRDQIHTLLVLATYGLMYQLPAMVVYWLLKRWRATAMSAAVVISGLCHIVLFFDSKLFDLYGFHINGFVWNLLTSRGGLESLGADQTNFALVLGYVLALASVHISGLLLSREFPDVRIPLRAILLMFIFATLAERGVYGYSRAELYAPVLTRGDAMPLYQPMKMNTFLERMGVKVQDAKIVKLSLDDTQIKYPLNPLQVTKVDKPLNILMLVSESMRWELLTPRIMPNMSEFARQAWNFKNHYSGGNGTRQGLFAMFYGISGDNWDRFLRSRRGPVFFDVLANYDYQYFTYTSAQFTYPEFDQTIFSQVPKEMLIENSHGEPWERDRDNTTALLDRIEHRDPEKPYFGFLFFEATHARYSFAEEHVVNSDYVRTLDYAGLSREQLAPQIKQIKARYENAAYNIDLQLKRIVDHLRNSGELDNTLIVITGDHGEEFMERGRWGHNSSFNDWQVRVPMIVWMPNSSAQEITQRTSHMDVVPTILPRLGLKNPLNDYTLGVDLSEPEENRNILVASWSDLGLINDDGKLVIPFKSTTQHQNLATDLHDNPVDGSRLVETMRSTLFQVLAETQSYKK